MAHVADFVVLQVGQQQVSPRSSGVSPFILPFGTDIEGRGHAIFQLMYRGLQRQSVEVFVNDNKAVDLLPHSFAAEGDWFQTSFITPPGLVGRSNRIRFDAAPDETYFVGNLVCWVKQDA